MNRAFMNIRRIFNQWATGFGLGLGLILNTNGNPLMHPPIPAGSNPDYLPRVYEHIINTSRTASRTNSDIRAPIAHIADIPNNDWLHRLRSMSPAEAAEEIRGCFQTFCEHKYPLLSEDQRFIARIIVIETMFHDGLNDEEFRTYSEYLGRFQPDMYFHRRDEALIETITDKIINSREYENLKRQILPSTRITATNAREQFNIRKDFINRATHEIRTAYNMDSVTTYIDNFPQQLHGAAAYALSQAHHPELPTNRAVLFNYAVSSAHNIETLLDITAHEVRHTMDFDDRDRVYRREITVNDVSFKHIAVINLNHNLYIPLCAQGTHSATSCPQQFEDYKNQYVERSAQDFARKLLERFRIKLRTAEALRKTSQSSPSTDIPRLKTQELKLPA